MGSREQEGCQGWWPEAGCPRCDRAATSQVAFVVLQGVLVLRVPKKCCSVFLVPSCYVCEDSSKIIPLPALCKAEGACFCQPLQVPRVVEAEKVPELPKRRK